MSAIASLHHTVVSGAEGVGMSRRTAGEDDVVMAFPDEIEMEKSGVALAVIQA
jgi:hypothetical protein